MYADWCVFSAKDIYMADLKSVSTSADCKFPFRQELKKNLSEALITVLDVEINFPCSYPLYPEY